MITPFDAFEILPYVFENIMEIGAFANAPFSIIFSKVTNKVFKTLLKFFLIFFLMLSKNRKLMS